MASPTRSSQFLLSKTSFLEGRQCPLRLWLRAGGVKEVPPGVTTFHNPAEDFVEQSREVERLAEGLFPGGLDVAEIAALDDRAAVELTRELMEDPHTLSLFQAEFRTADKIGIVDILERDEEDWILYEIKASTSVKPIFRWDLAFQWLLLEECGYPVSSAQVLLLDREYVHAGGQVDPDELLVTVDCTSIVRALLPAVREEVERQKLILLAEEPPVVQPSNRCRGNRSGKAGDRPSDCGHLHSLCHCGSGLSEHWSFKLPRLSQPQADYLLDEGLLRIEDLAPEDAAADWSELQQRVMLAVQQDEVWVDEEGLGAELDRLQWPLAFVDFEFDPGMAVPRFPGMRPYQQIPFQWSLQVQESLDSPLEDVEPFLHDAADDPREAFLESLLASLPDYGSIVVHYQQAEWGVLNHYHDWFPDRYDAQLADIRSRFADTCQIARDCYYHPAMRGSFSIKNLAPAALGRGYEDLEIQDGMAAVRQWRRLIAPETAPEERESMRRDLLAYCHRDTKLMFDILEAFRRLVR
jgi:hypothetical protein